MSDFTSIRRLFEQAKASRVVHLDDTYAAVTEDPLTEFQISTLARVLGVESDDGDDAAETLVDEVKERVADLGADDLARLCADARAIEGDEPVTPGVFRELFRDTIQSVAPGANIRETFDLLAAELDKGAAETTIVFVDEDLGQGQLGRDIAKRLLEEREDLLALFLVTHIAGSPDGESEVETDLGIEEIVVLAKSRFSSDVVADNTDTDMRGFAARLRRGMVATRIRSLKKRVSEAVDTAAREAGDRFGELSVDELDFIVGRTAKDEGAWLGDLFIRILGRSFEHATMLELRTDDGIHESAAAMSRLCDDEFEFGATPPRVTEKAIALQRHEMFLTGDVLRKAGVETRAGDVFEEGGARLILVGQACDLAVRSDGRRDPKSDLDQMGWLASVSQADELTTERGTFDHILRHMEGAGQGKVWKAKISRSMLIPLWILDLAVFHEKGACTISSTDSCPTTLPPSWRARFDVVKGYAESLVKTYAERPDEELRLIAGLPRASKRVKLTKSVNKKRTKWSLGFKLKRVCHLESKYSEELLRLKSAYMMRWAVDKDFSDSPLRRATSDSD